MYYIFITIISSKYLNNQFKYIKCKIICLLFGFFVATILSTISAQTGDWSIIAAAIIIAYNEIISKMVYKHPNNQLIILTIINNLKIGIIYGLLVDAFKLGS
uniref:hypothetical protein n=1 Tax=Hypnea pseudomusciformis TaxID=1545697 RepID=UPI0027DA2CC6|nr:hypothetical protein P4C74_pgp138 [Hypnea pseudomusciformis]WCH55095.1 hypothetical protein [Hypnea pseudomusciformis]WCH56688.1 hypothetical protein [Hypnea pseudomusciformis]